MWSVTQTCQNKKQSAGGEQCVKHWKWVRKVKMRLHFVPLKIIVLMLMHYES